MGSTFKIGNFLHTCFKKKLKINLNEKTSISTYIGYLICSYLVLFKLVSHLFIAGYRRKCFYLLILIQMTRLTREAESIHNIPVLNYITIEYFPPEFSDHNMFKMSSQNNNK